MPEPAPAGNLVYYEPLAKMRCCPIQVADPIRMTSGQERTMTFRAIRSDSRSSIAAVSLALGALLTLSVAACASEVGSQETPKTPIASASATDVDAVLATIDGAPISVADLGEAVSDRLAMLAFEYNTQRFQLLEAGVQDAVRQRLLDAEAIERGITTEEMLEAEVNSEIDITATDVQVWYDANTARLQGRPLEGLRPAIEQFLFEQRQEEGIEALTTELAGDRSVTLMLEPVRAEIETEGYPSFGPADAPITLVELSDFECPFCGRFTPTVDQVKDAYAGSVRLVYRQFPLREIHPNAQKAAEASLCAEEQGKFWELHDLMFEEQDMLTVDDLKEKAERLDMDTAAFATCLDSDRYADAVQADVRAGQRLGVDGTPALFVNGRPVPGGAVPFEAIAKVIDEELGRAGR